MNRVQPSFASSLRSQRTCTPPAGRPAQRPALGHRAMVPRLGRGDLEWIPPGHCHSRDQRNRSRGAALCSRHRPPGKTRV